MKGERCRDGGQGTFSNSNRDTSIEGKRADDCCVWMKKLYCSGFNHLVEASGCSVKQLLAFVMMSDLSD